MSPDFYVTNFYLNFYSIESFLKNDLLTTTGGLNIDSKVDDEADRRMELREVIKPDNPEQKCASCYRIHNRKGKEKEKGRKDGST